jgi:dTDP-4-amino-4,6-dideoxygalactose transaminase
MTVRQAVDEAVAFSVPQFTEQAKAAAQRVLDSGWVTTGPESHQFEEELAIFLGQPHAVTVASCTQAIELSLRALRLPAGTAVLTPSLTFCGAVAAIVHAGCRPVLVDVDPGTLVPNPETVAAAVRRAGPVGAMLVCDLGGYPVDHIALASAAGLPYGRVIVDAAHGPGGAIGRATAATAPFATCLSFYATKNLPIGEGGAVLTYDEEFSFWLRSARLHGMSRDAWRRYRPGGSWRYEVAEIGHKANMTDLQAAIGRAQLAALPAWQAARARVVAGYDAAFAPLIERGAIQVPHRPDGHSFHLYQIRVRHRDEVIDRLADRRIGTSVHFIPVHRLRGYAQILDDRERSAVPMTDLVADELLSLPLYPGLSDAQTERIASHVIDAVESFQPRGNGRRHAALAT